MGPVGEHFLGGPDVALGHNIGLMYFDQICRENCPRGKVGKPFSISSKQNRKTEKEEKKIG